MSATWALAGRENGDRQGGAGSLPSGVPLTFRVAQFEMWRGCWHDRCLLLLFELEGCYRPCDG